MFDEYAEKLKKLNADVPKIFEKVAKKGALKFEQEAKKRTDREGLVDTGNYRRNWEGQAIEIDSTTQAIVCSNSVNYASHLEYGHKMRDGKIWKGRFVGDLSMQETNYYCLQQLDKELEKAYKQM